MCTLVLAWQIFDGTPIAVGANRDESLGRPSLPPRVLDTDPQVVAPQDEEAGGTWIGYNDEGVFVAITNRRSETEGERSRGLLVRDALGQSSAAAAGSVVRNELGGREYAGFNLVVADAEEAGLLEWDGVLRSTHFDPGVHVVVDAGYDDAAPKARRVRDAVRPAPEMSVEAWFDRVAVVLRNHDLDACIHGADFGTRSSSLLGVDADGGGRYWFADDRPCETDYEVVAVGEDGEKMRLAASTEDRPDGADGQV